MVNDKGKSICYTLTIQKYAPVAQLDRVLVSEAKGRGFDSRRAHQAAIRSTKCMTLISFCCSHALSFTKEFSFVSRYLGKYYIKPNTKFDYFLTS